MHPGEIFGAMRERPFRPLRLCLSDGSSHTICHPDGCVVETALVHIGVPDPSGPDGPYQKTVRCAPEHVIRIEPLEPAAGSKSP